MADQEFKRHVAYKFVIGDLNAGKPIFDAERFKLLELKDKNISRVNLIANIVDKYNQENEGKKFASITLDDASGQIKVKAFGDETAKISELNQGETIQVIGLLRMWNNELYLTPEIIKKRTPEYLLLRKLEMNSFKPQEKIEEQENNPRNKILAIVKKEDENGGANTDTIIMELNTISPQAINKEIQRLLEEGIIYEPRPGKIRYLG